MPGSTSIAGAGDVDGATGGGEKLTTPESGADIADIAAESIASSLFDALVSAWTIAFTAPRSAAESGVPRLTA
jgi:hypothetical protein